MTSDEVVMYVKKVTFFLRHSVVAAAVVRTEMILSQLMSVVKAKNIYMHSVYV